MDTASFIARWAGSGGAERANYGLFLSELCRVLEVPEPEPTQPDDADNAYVFEKSVLEPHDEGKPTVRRIDLYKRGCFVLEAKQGVEQEAEDEARVRQAKRKAGTKKGHGTRGTKGWDTFMQRARGQAESYVRLLPDGEGRPPFVLVVDVGHAIEIYAEFTRTGGVYRPFPDVRSYRVTMEDLRRPEVRERLRAVWEEPLSLDPSLRAAEVTRQVADTLARISRSMEGELDANGVPMTPERVSGFLIRMIFTMFAEDVGLIPEGKFRRALETMKGRPEAFVPSLQNLWDAMARGGYSIALQEQIKHFNGGLFEDVEVLPVTAEQLGLFTEAAGRDWSEVEPSIFGTLVERALNPRERHKLGAHYTPRAYVERLVEQVVMTPLQADWQNVQVEVQNALSRAADDKALAAARVKARGFVEAFVAQLQQTTVMDPACGTGNFLYVAMELIKRLEAEVVETLQALGGQAPLIGVSPEQFIGLELNPRAARVAELVLWIGYLQLYAREHGHAAPPEPILKAFHNIRQMDAALAYSGRRPKVDKEGKPVTRWDGMSVITNPTTGQEVPDPGAVVQDEVYENPTPVMWPRADFIVGNPPFIGAGPMRFALGDGYTETLRKTYPEVPESADFVMFWWYKAAQLLTLEQTKAKRLRRFGFVTTNSLKQTFNRRVMERFLGKGLSLAYAVPDHPWVDEADGAAVRIAMTVAEPGKYEGVLTRVTGEKVSGNGEYDIVTVDEAGVIHSDLTVGVNVTEAKELKAMGSISNPGVKLHGSGFIVTRKKAAELGLGKRAGLEQHTREYRNGKDLTNRPRDVLVIDLFGLSADEVRDRYPEVYQHVLTSVKPERDQNNRAGYRDNWWVFGEPRRAFRPALAGLPRYIATVETSKHRFFQFLDASILPDNMLVAVAHDDAYVLGVLSSRIHIVWALALGGRLGVGNDSRYNKTRCFETFPFPAATEEQKETVRALAERLDAFRKDRIAEHPALTMTALYNALEDVRAGRELNAKAKAVFEQGLVATLLSLHDDLDAAVAEAYGWVAGLPTQELLGRLLELNVLRTREEKAGLVRYLRPGYQDPKAAQQSGLGLAVAAPAVLEDEPLEFPGKLSEQAQRVRQVLQASARPLTTADLVNRLKGARKDRVEEIVEMLVELGQVRQLGDHDVAFAA